MAVEIGARGEIRVIVGEGDTALALGSGDVRVLATPRMVLLCEEAAVLALAGRFEAGQTSVGMRVQVDHIRPTGVGVAVVAEATLERVEGRRLIFHVSVSDPAGLVATGRITRVVVDRARFMDKVCSGGDT